MQWCLIKKRVLEIAATCIQAYVMHGQPLSVISGKLALLMVWPGKTLTFSIRSRLLQKLIGKKNNSRPDASFA